jgi:hypothetical protein
MTKSENDLLNKAINILKQIEKKGWVCSGLMIDTSYCFPVELYDEIKIFIKKHENNKKKKNSKNKE